MTSNRTDGTITSTKPMKFLTEVFYMLKSVSKLINQRVWLKFVRSRVSLQIIPLNNINLNEPKSSVKYFRSQIKVF